MGDNKNGSHSSGKSGGDRRTNSKPGGRKPGAGKPGRGRPTGGRPGAANKSAASKGAGKPESRAERRRFKPIDRALEGIAARDAAAVLVHEVISNRRPLDDVLLDAAAFPQLADLSRADRGFARAIAATSLRRLGQIDDALSRFMDRGVPDNSGLLREILLIAGAQLMFLDSPPHAVINVAVQQAKRGYKSRRYDKLTNAVLRRVSENAASILKEQDAARLNTPNWLWNAWVRAYGKDGARRIGEAHQHQALLDLTVKRDPQRWAKKTGGELLPTGAIRLKHKGRIEKIDGFDEGAWWVQDMAAALPVKLLGDVRGQSVADLAAAPGGKTAQLAALGAQVTSVDWSAGRLGRLRENLQRLNLKAEVIKADILEWKPKEKFDAILLDAPCTATGTIRRHPDLPFLKKKADIDELAKIQMRLLDRALTLLKPGGLMVYCVCSLQPEEGPQQIEALLERNKKAQLLAVDATQFNGRPQWINEEGCLRTFPYQLPADDAAPGMDGFFAARLRLKK